MSLFLADWLRIASQGMIVITGLSLNHCAGRDNRLNPPIVGWEIPEKEGRKACSGLFSYGSMRPLRMAYRTRLAVSWMSSFSMILLR